MAAGIITPVGTYKDIDIRNKKKYDILCYHCSYDGSADPTIVQPALANNRSGIVAISYSCASTHGLRVTVGGQTFDYPYGAFQAPFFRQGKPLWITDENEDLVLQPSSASAIIMLLMVVQWPTNRIIPSFGS